MSSKFDGSPQWHLGFGVRRRSWLIAWVAVTVAVSDFAYMCRYVDGISTLHVSAWLAWICGGSSRSGGASIAGTTIGGCPAERSSRSVLLADVGWSSGSVSVGVRAGP
jgi:hypothetical protein